MQAVLPASQAPATAPPAAPAAPPAPVAPAQEQLDRYAAEGYVRWGQLLAPAELETLRAEYDRVFAEAWEQDGYNNLSGKPGSDPQAKRSGRQMLQIMQMCERSLIFRRLLYDERILAVVRAIIGPNVMLFHDQALFKPARTGGPVLWHQDNGYWRCAPANLISCWMTLDDAVAENGAMQVIPGSHLAPARHGKRSEADTLLEVDGIPVERAVVVDLPAGGCMFHHCQTLHYTAPNDTERQRRAFTIHYMPTGTVDRDGKLMKAGWNRPVLSSAG